jgi:hypothetical protein
VILLVATIIVDSGTSLLAGPPTIVAQVKHAIGAAGTISAECKEVREYGEMILQLLIAGKPTKGVHSDRSLYSMVPIRSAT